MVIILFINHIIKATTTSRITSKWLTSKSDFFFSSVVTDVKPKIQCYSTAFLESVFVAWKFQSFKINFDIAKIR